MNALQRTIIRTRGPILLGNRRGTTLIEALVAVAILALAIGGASLIIAQSYDALGMARDEARARDELALRLADGMEGDGTIDWPGVSEARWMVTRSDIARSTLAGTQARWERLEATIAWQREAETFTLRAERITIVPDRPATP